MTRNAMTLPVQYLAAFQYDANLRLSFNPSLEIERFRFL
jgi:hypothetical protein